MSSWSGRRRAGGGGGEGRVRLIDSQNASASPELSVLAPIVDFTDPELSEGRGTHDAWLDRHVEDCIFKEVWVSSSGAIPRCEGWVGKYVVDRF